MKNIKSIVPLLPAQQMMLSATLKDKPELYVQQLLFEVKGYGLAEISTALDKLIDSYECFRSLILYEGLKQAVWVSKDEVKPIIKEHKLLGSDLTGLTQGIRIKGFNFQQEACIRFDWIETTDKNYLCITNHHILFDGWGKQLILSDFIRALKFPSSYLIEKQNKSWYDAWTKLDHEKAIGTYKNYLSHFEDFASISQISSLEKENLEYKTSITSENIKKTSKNLGLTGAELINFCWSIFVSIWTQNERIQFGVVKQNGLIDQVKNGFGMGIQTLPFQFIVDFNLTVREQLSQFKTRERAVSAASFANSLDPIFSQLSYNFLIAFENYPLEQSLGAVESNFNLLYSYDRSEFPLSLAISPNDLSYDFDWHYNTSFHRSEQIICLANKFISFLESFEGNMESTPLSLCEKWFLSQNVNKPIQAIFDKKVFSKKLIDHLTNEHREIYDHLLPYFESSINRIWIYGDKHENMLPVISVAWSNNVEVLTINEKESDSFIEKLFEFKHPDLIFSSLSENRFENFISLQDNLAELKFDEKKVKKEDNNALSICTSGSTGEPKIVQLTIENINAFFHAWEEKLPWREHEHFAAIAHPAFDIGIAELMFPLWKGWKLTLFDKTILSDSTLLNQELSNISAFHMVPSLLEEWIDHAKPDEKERLIMTGGDKVPPHLHSKLIQKFPKTRLFQFYGPSECSVLASGFENYGQFEKNLLPLGMAFNHAEISIFGNENLPLSPYQEGEIVVLGPAVGIGYANEDNTQKFITFHHERAFKTGDFGFKSTDGNLFFRGRKDRQIKINGQRIELTRIEAALSEWSSIENWIVIPADKMLFAFAKSPKRPIPEREKLQHWLPFYAIPQHIQLLEDFPLNKNGKVDQLKLIQMGASALNTMEHHGTILPEIEACLRDLFKDRTLNFSIGWYANGLNSIDALKLSGILKTKLKISLDLNQILLSENLFKICQTNTTSSQEELSLNVIEVGKKVHSTAARLIFLSESDELFSKSYWISSGFKLPDHFDWNKLKKWIKEQANLHLSVSGRESDYFWGKGEQQLHEFEVEHENEFIEKVENTFVEIETALFITFLGRSNNEHYLAFKVHHALLDGLGLESIWEKLYSDLSNNQYNTLKLIAPKEEEIEENFWQNYLANVEVTPLAFERQNSTIPSVNRINIELSIKEKSLLDQLCSQHNCSLFEAGLILFARMLKHYTPINQAIGIPINIGEYIDPNHISAMSVNILPFKTAHENDEEILANWRKIFQKRFTPFSKIAELEKMQKNGIPFFNCTYLYHSQKSDLKGLTPIEFKRAATDFHVSLDFIEAIDKFIFAWEYRSDLFSETAIRQFHQHFFFQEEKQMTKSFEKKGELKWIWNNVVQSFSMKTGLIVGSESYTYLEINQSICQKREQYIQKETIDILILERNKESICLLLFHLIDGIPFIPIDAELSDDRIEQIQQVSRGIHTSQKEFDKLQYVIATSGTTGIPKLVGVKKSGYESAINAWVENYEMKAEDCCLQAASFSFDVSLGDLGRCFFNGSKMILLDSSERKDPTLILEKINEFSVTVFETTPLIVRWWLTDELNMKDLPSLRLLIVGSDSWKMSELRALKDSKSEKQRIISSYGLSETTIDNSYFDPEIDDHEEYPDEMVVPIGKAMKHCELRISTESGKHTADGMSGFITIEGPAVGLGYFIDGKWSKTNDEIWISKDRGICDEWGNFHFKGRSDRQVKIRGQRVELEEIERVLSRLAPKQLWCVVDFEHEFSCEMAAFHTGDLTNESLTQLKTALVEKYPSYFLPSLFEGIEQLPLNTNGKTDVSLLRKIAIEKSFSSPLSHGNSETIVRLIAHFNQCFGQEITAFDNFFQFGKNSFDAMHFVRSWNKLYQEKMAVHQLFSSENFESLARLVDLQTIAQNPKNIIRKISKAQEAIWFEIKNGNASLFNIPHFIEIPKSYDVKKFKLAFERTLKISAALFVRFEETEIGDVITHTVDSSNYEMPIFQLEDLDTFKQNAFNKKFDFSHGPAFEAAILQYQNKTFVYFNPHHLVYDGGSDAHFSKMFLEFYEDRNYMEDDFSFALPGEKISWTNYFQLHSAPEVHFHKANTAIQASLILACTENEFSKIKELTLAYQCTQSVIISHLLSKALYSIGININWISLVLDHRLQDGVGMHMRAYPFPAYDPNSETDLSIAKQKWALSQLFAASEQNIIYPDSTPIEAYNQVGLIIQHPFYIQDLTFEEEKIEYARPRIPISLYVEEMNERLFFRWSFDHDQITLTKIKQLHESFFQLTEELATTKKEIVPFKPEVEEILRNATHGDIQPKLLTIWSKYVGGNQIKSPHFFEAGANSIKALLMLKEIEKLLKIRISPADFFRQPTLDFLNQSNSKFESNKLVWQMKKSIENEELWLLPPIMGHGIIFNALETPNKNVFAFNYPLAMGINGLDGIEVIARQLIHERERIGKLPSHVTILGYSMGGLSAFEMAKWLESHGVKVNKLIVLDKTAQPEPGNKLKRVNLKSELIDVARQIATDDMDFERIQNYLKSHEQMIEEYQQSGCLDCPIDIYHCSDGFPESDFLKWQRFTKQMVQVIKIENCSHYEIPKIWNNLNLNF
jgi:non-ribosomal peptide synthetase component F/surfactin synthase thioesterase subunit/acyl carrier protein